MDPGCNLTKTQDSLQIFVLIVYATRSVLFSAWIAAKKHVILGFDCTGKLLLFLRREEGHGMFVFFLKPESSGSVRLKAVTDSQLTVTWWNISAADSDCFHIHTHSYKHKHNDGVMLENMLMKDVYALVSWLTLIHFKGAKFNSL